MNFASEDLQSSSVDVIRCAWSNWLPLDTFTVRESVPKTPGVYQIRPIGASGPAYIGSATGKGGLKQRLKQRASNPKRNLSGFEKKLVQLGFQLEFCYAEADTVQCAKDRESQLLNRYRLSHNGQLPPGNKVTPRSSRT